MANEQPVIDALEQITPGEAVDVMTKAARHLMGQTDIWYNASEREAVAILFVSASTLRKEYGLAEPPR